MTDKALAILENYMKEHKISSRSKVINNSLEQLQPLEPSEKQVVEKALGLRDYPTDCHDMILTQGEPTAKECMCPNSLRPISLPQRNGKFIVESPQKCWRCRALGYRKEKKQSQPKRRIYREKQKKPKKQSYGTSKIEMGNSEGISMFDLPKSN